jgi:hypothetical protein
LTQCLPGFISGQSRESLEHDKGTLRASGGRKAYGSWSLTNLAGFPMSFIPALPDLRTSSLSIPAGTLSVQVGAVTNDLSNKGTMTVTQPNSSPQTKLVKRKLPRARKARARLRQQNKQRAAAVRTN